MNAKQIRTMSNEIKQGDKVRVSEDAPRIYTPDWVDAMFDLVLKVTAVEDGNAMVEFAKRTQYRTVLTAIPCKYLAKVDAEAKAKIGSDKWVEKTVWNYKNHKKGVIRRMTDGVAEVFTEDGRLQTWQITDLVDEYDDTIEKWKCPEANAPKIKVGDRVRKGCLRGIVKEVASGNVIVDLLDRDGKSLNTGLFDVWMIDSVESADPAEQTDAGTKTDEVDFSVADTPESIKGRIKQQTEAEKTDSDIPFSIFRDGELFDPRIVNLHNGMHYWQHYEANLAKEVVLKVANKYEDPKKAAEYAVQVAKAVAEGLKRE